MKYRTFADLDTVNAHIPPFVIRNEFVNLTDDIRRKETAGL
jgi:hypothetical protein